MDTEPLICAKCAERRQSPREYQECIWHKEDDKYVGTFTGKNLPLPKWEVNEKGKVPSYLGPGPEERPRDLTDQLIIDLSDVDIGYPSGSTTMIPAIYNEDGQFWGYTSVPQECYKLWEELPLT